MEFWNNMDPLNKGTVIAVGVMLVSFLTVGGIIYASTIPNEALSR